MFRTTTLLLVILAASAARAMLFPVHPLEDTVYTAGQAGEVSWVDDGTKPNMKNLGSMTVNLVCECDEEIHRCRREERRHEGEIEAITCAFSMLSFAFKSSTQTVYTADFTIDAARNATTNTTSAGPLPAVTLVLPSTTITSTLSTPYGQAASTVQTVWASPIGSSKAGVSRAQAQRSSARERSMDMEKLKFRLVFILWPAIIGITMAM